LIHFGTIGWVNTRTFSKIVARLLTAQFKVPFGEQKVERKVRHILDSFEKLEQSSSATMVNISVRFDF
jgi:hypothetical protein